MTNGESIPKEFWRNLGNMFHYPGWFRSIFGIFIAYAFHAIFSSPFLGLLALAFLFYIPVPRDTRMFANINTYIFIGLMIYIIYSAFGGGLGLDLCSTSPCTNPFDWRGSAIVFLAVWLISFLVGLSSDIRARQNVGMLMIIVSFVIFTIGIGTQEVGTAFFGQWWPQVYQAGSSIFGPIGSAFSQLQQTLGQGFLLLTDPVGYAQQMMNGTYSTDPLSGLAGAYGVEIEQFSTTPIFPYQTFQVMVRMKNMGAYDAKDLNIILQPGPKATYTSVTSDIGIQADGQSKDSQQKSELVRMDIWQPFFTGNITCEKINDLRLRQRATGTLGITKGAYAIPITAKLGYNYQISSELNLEFMSNSEWDRLVKEGKLVTQTKKPATLTNAPVRLNIDTLEQPIKEGTPFFVGLALTPAKAGNITAADVQLEIPQNFEKTTCTPSNPSSQTGNILIWENLTKPYVIYCQFNAMKDMTSPTQTFLIKANASYAFQTTKDMIASVDFGGGCCKNDDCPTNYTCDGAVGKMGYCVLKGGGLQIPTDPTKVGAKKYCENLLDTGHKCKDGEGQCEVPAQCQEGECRTINNLKICCSGTNTNQFCYDRFVNSVQS